MATPANVPGLSGLYYYSFKDLMVVFFHPLLGEFQMVGEIGFNQLTISYDTERTSHEVAADGSVQITYRAGNNGRATIETQQASALNEFLVAWANSCFVNGNLQNITNFAKATIFARSLLNGTTHLLQGISPLKIPDRQYAANGGNVTWTLMAGDIETT